MTTTTAKNHATMGTAARVLQEGYGPGAWHGPDIKAALADVDAAQAFTRPAAGRHNIAEIAIHHAYYVHAVRDRLTGTAAEPFVLEGEDWFELDPPANLSWPEIQRVVEAEHGKLAELVDAIDAGRTSSPLPPAERFELALGITCHAAYHAGQIQLVKKLIA